MPVLRLEAGKFHGLFIVNQNGLVRKKDEQSPSLVHEATSTTKVQSSTTRSNSNRILLAFFPLP